MPVNERLPVKRLMAEGFVIVVSVLLALGADAWWDGRQQDEAVANHLRALRRDFGQMRARMDSVVDQTSRNIEASQFLLGRLSPEAPPIPADSLYGPIIGLVDYAVFSPSTAAYASLTATGQIELLEDAELKAGLADFFGYFDDFGVTEAAIQRVVFDLLLSSEFGSLVGYDRLMRFYGGGALPDGPIDTRRLAQSRELMNHLGVLSAMYYQASADYGWMSARITEIEERLGSAVE